MGAFHGVRGARAFRRYLSQRAVAPEADARVLEEALALVEDRVLEELAG
jgi:tRNA-dihydrouridine synthase A